MRVASSGNRRQKARDEERSSADVDRGAEYELRRPTRSRVENYPVGS